MSTRVLVPLVDGVEEIEAVAIIDILRRAGAEVITAADAPVVVGRSGIRIGADATLADQLGELWDAIALPGGPGTRTLLANEGLRHALQRHSGEGKVLAAICAAPTVLAAAGLLEGKCACCHPTAEAAMAGAHLSHERVVVEGRLITSRGAGTAVEFALALAALLCGQQHADQVAAAIIAR